MKLILEDHPEFNQAFQEAFGILVQKLGIENHKAVVHLRFEHNPVKDRIVFGFRLGQQYEGGRVENYTTYDADGTVHIRMILNTAPAPTFAIQAISDNYIMGSFAHEMTHVKQMIVGDLKATTEVVIWKGQEVSWHSAYRDRPWEKEAFQFQEEAINLVRNLDPLNLVK